MVSFPFTWAHAISHNLTCRSGQGWAGVPRGTEGRALEAKGLGHSSCHKGSEEEEVAFLGGRFPYSLQTCPTNCQIFPSESSQGSCSEASKNREGSP